MKTQLQLVLLILLPFIAWSDPAFSDSAARCIESVDADFRRAEQEAMLNGSLSGQTLCLLVESRFNALDRCLRLKLDKTHQIAFDKNFEYHLQKNKAVTADEAEVRIERLKSRWLRSSFNEQIKITESIRQIRTCFIPQEKTVPPDVTYQTAR